MISNIKFSIIIPSYNRANYLDILLKDLQNQTLQTFEVVICDDGSTDNTESVVNKYKILLDIKYIKLSNSGGPALPRNIGIQNSKYKWLCFLDSDDLWTNTKLEVLKKSITKYSEKIYCHPVQVFGENYNKNEIIGRYRRGFLLTDFKSLLYNGNKIVNSSLCINKEILSSETLYNTESSYHGIEDYIFLLNLTKLGYKIKVLDNILGYYRIHDNNISSDSHKQLQKIRNFFQSCNYRNVSMNMINAQLEYTEISISNFNKFKRFKLYLEIIFKPSTIEIKLKSFLKSVFY